MMFLTSSRSIIPNHWRFLYVLFAFARPGLPNQNGILRTVSSQGRFLAYFQALHRLSYKTKYMQIAISDTHSRIGTLLSRVGHFKFFVKVALLLFSKSSTISFIVQRLSNNFTRLSFDTVIIWTRKEYSVWLLARKSFCDNFFQFGSATFFKTLRLKIFA